MICGRTFQFDFVKSSEISVISWFSILGIGDLLSSEPSKMIGDFLPDLQDLWPYYPFYSFLNRLVISFPLKDI
jgi:hypothetical protein